MTTDLSSIRHVVLDMDGTIYLGESLFPDTLPFLNMIDSMGIKTTFFTNNNSFSQAEYLVRLEKLGIHTALRALSRPAIPPYTTWNPTFPV